MSGYNRFGDCHLTVLLFNCQVARCCTERKELYSHNIINVM